MDSGKEEEIRLEHKLELRRILIDRIGIGLLIIGAAFASNYVLEQIKKKSTKEVFMLEKKLEAISMAQEIHSKITTYLYTSLGLECRDPTRKIVTTESFQTYQSLDSRFRSQVNSRIYLLSKDYQNSVNGVHNIVAGVASIVGNTRDPDCALRPFLHDVMEGLELATRRELDLDVSGFPAGFSLIEKLPTEIEQLGLLEYLELNLDAWKSKHN